MTAALPPLDEIVAALHAPHIVTLTDTGYGLAHPLACRPNLTDCPVERGCREWTSSPDLPGRYEATWDGAWVNLGARDPDPGPNWDATVRALVAEVAYLRACLDDRNTSGRDRITRIGKL